jgi:hypothetical protein
LYRRIPLEFYDAYLSEEYTQSVIYCLLNTPFDMHSLKVQQKG